ncbi:MAG: SUMF1/EgtB/PvdO family nonheme iron enzyme [Acidobacteria bacterium]|jgi:formylglycine-generating enzyme required for sulfatase activity|nr:SUMF1/EgtB/PvdO family nonheme iron enzyme [Acidobacteriota bacterium]
MAAGIATVASLAAAPQAPDYRETIPGTTVSFDMVHVPAGTVVVNDKSVTIAPFYVGKTEVTWDMYDVFALGLDTPATRPEGTDAIARPSNPYGAPDYGWGHSGYPVISVTRQAAEAYTTWLSQKTGRVYRLPTEAEWFHMAELGKGTDDLAADRLEALAWHRDNGSSRTHQVGTKTPDRLGLFDLFGNAAEWVMTQDGSLVTRGGSFRDDPAVVSGPARAAQDESWNERDPQLPKSRWWLSDGPFVGFRLVREIKE